MPYNLHAYQDSRQVFRLPSVDLVSLRTTSLCTPPSPLSKLESPEFIDWELHKVQICRYCRGESNCFFPSKHGSRVHMILSKLYVDGIYVSLEAESSENSVRLLYGSNFDPQFYGIDLKPCSSNITSGVYSDYNTWNMHALSSPLTLTSTQSYLIDENVSNVSLLYEGKCESETKWLAVVVKETYTSHTAVLQSSNMNISFLHGSNVYIRDLTSSKIHSVFVSSFQRLQFGSNVNLLNRTKIYQTGSGAEGYIYIKRGPKSICCSYLKQNAIHKNSK